MSMEEKTVEYCFDSNIYTGEDIKTKIEEIKRGFSRISNKPVVVRVELNELGIYVLSFKIYAKRKIAKMKPEKLNKVYIESLGEYSNGYINKLIENKDDKYIKKLKSKSKEQKDLEKQIKNRNKEQKELDKRLKEVAKQQNKQKVKKQKEAKKQAKVEYIKENTKKVEQTKPKEKVKQYNNYRSKEDTNKINEEKMQRTPHIEYLYREEESKNFKEMLNDFLQMLKNIKSPKLERKNKSNEKIKAEKSEKQYHYHYKQNNKKQNLIGEKHYWSDNYIPKEYGKYKETKKEYKPL